MKALIKHNIIAMAIVFNTANATIAEPDIIKVRELYFYATQNETRCIEFESYLNKNPGINPSLLMGYKGVALMLKAKYEWIPLTKLNYFNRGKNFLEEAIRSTPQSVELRFLRLAVQNNAPALLNYSWNIEEDKKFILKSFPQLNDPDLKQRIKIYSNTTHIFTDKERSILNES